MIIIDPSVNFHFTTLPSDTNCDPDVSIQLVLREQYLLRPAAEILCAVAAGMLSALEADRARVAEIDAEIIQLQHLLSALRDEKEPAQRRLESYKYPVLTLPNEIVAEIFIHFLPRYPKCPPITGIYSPNVLAQICSQWREIALATPALWRAVALCMSSSKDMCRTKREYISLERQLQASDIWLDRSLYSPLSVQIISDDGERRAPETFVAMLQHQARWEHLKLSFVECSLPATEDVMLSLRGLHLKRRKSGPGIFALRDAPLLRTVIIDTDDIASVALPWTQLTSITLRTLTSSECLRILRQTPALVHCRLDLVFDSETDQLGIALPRLKSLALDHPWNEPSRAGFLKRFIVPALQSLHTSQQILEPNPIQSLASFISRCGCKLQELHVGGGVTFGRPATLLYHSYEEAFSSIATLTFGAPGSYVAIWE
ncbi:hypothetical protein C8R47DRAFT_1199871 [Mycena vitilis]|nr:hypothetical protein C8R47DRAFT_1199871 [Mycena vitilis]